MWSRRDILFIVEVVEIGNKLWIFMVIDMLMSIFNYLVLFIYFNFIVYFLIMYEYDLCKSKIKVKICY